MAAMAPTLHNLYLSKGKVHVIVDHNDILYINLEIICQLLEGNTASVHIRKGLDQKYLLEPHTRAGVGSIEFFLVHTAPGPIRQGIDDIKADIMTGPGILFSRISQTR